MVSEVLRGHWGPSLQGVENPGASFLLLMCRVRSPLVFSPAPASPARDGCHVPESGCCHTFVSRTERFSFLPSAPGNWFPPRVLPFFLKKQVVFLLLCPELPLPQFSPSPHAVTAAQLRASDHVLFAVCHSVPLKPCPPCHLPLHLHPLWERRPGARCFMQTLFLAGWYEGERLRDGERGWFPMECAKEITCQATIDKNVERMGRLLGLETNV